MKFYQLVEPQESGEDKLLAYVADSERGGPVAAFWHAGAHDSDVVWASLADFQAVSMGMDRNIKFPRPRRLEPLAQLPVSVDRIGKWLRAVVELGTDIVVEKIRVEEASHDRH